MSSSVADLHVGSAIYSSNGEKIGRLRFMMVDPESEMVSHLIVEKGMLLSQDVLAPCDTVSSVLHRGIFLTLTSEEVLALPEFNEARYLQRERAHHHHHEGGGHRHHDRGDRGDRGDRDHRGGDRGDRDGGGGGHRRRGRFRRH